MTVDSFHDCLDRCWLHQPRIAHYREGKRLAGKRSNQTNDSMSSKSIVDASRDFEFHCRSVNYNPKNGLCTLNQHNRKALPEAFRYLPVQSSSLSEMTIYADNLCVKCEFILFFFLFFSSSFFFCSCPFLFLFRLFANSGHHCFSFGCSSRTVSIRLKKILDKQFN